MAEILKLTNGAAISSASSDKTVQQVATFARLVTLDKIAPPPAGLTAAELNQFYMDALRDELIRYAKQEAARNRLKELKASTDLETQASNETQL